MEPILPGVFRVMTKFASTTDLYNIRQLNRAVYTYAAINIHNFGLMHNCIEITPSQDGQGTITSITTLQNLRRTITNENWNPEFAYMYRKLKFALIWSTKIGLNASFAGLTVNTLIQNVQNVITEIELSSFSTCGQLQNVGLEIGTFLQRFPNLDTVKINYCQHERKPRININHITTIIQLVDPNIQLYLIPIGKTRLFRKFLTTFPPIQNVHLILKTNSIEDLQELYRISELNRRNVTRISEIQIYLYIRPQYTRRLIASKESISRYFMNMPNLKKLCLNTNPDIPINHPARGWIKEMTAPETEITYFAHYTN